VDAESCHVGCSLKGLDCELFEFKDIVELFLTFVELHSGEFDAPGYFFLGLFNFVEVALAKHVEIDWVDVEVLL